MHALKLWAKIAGILALVPYASLLLLLCAGFFWRPFPKWVFEDVLIGLLAAVPLSIFSGIFWSKWLFTLAFLAAAIIVFVGYLSAGHLG